MRVDGEGGRQRGAEREEGERASEHEGGEGEERRGEASERGAGAEDETELDREASAGWRRDCKAVGKEETASG